MIEVAVVLAVAGGVGWLRPRWSSVSVALVPTTFALAWLLLHEDIPGDETTVSDIVWYVGMSLVVGAGVALACVLGIVARKRSRRCRSAAPTPTHTSLT